MNEIKHTHTQWNQIKHTHTRCRWWTELKGPDRLWLWSSPQHPLLCSIVAPLQLVSCTCPPTPAGTLTHHSSYPVQLLLIELDVPLNTKDPPVETQHALCGDQIWNLLMGCRSLRGGCGQRHHPTGLQSNNNCAGICACIIDVLFNGDEPDVNLSQNLLISLFFPPLPFFNIFDKLQTSSLFLG